MIKLYLSDVARLFLTLRDQLVSGDLHHAMRRHITVEQMERYSKYIDSKIKD